MESSNRARTTSRLYLAAPRRLAWITEELPPLGPHDVLVSTSTGAISIGSELPLYRGNSRASRLPQYPRSILQDPQADRKSRLIAQQPLPAPSPDHHEEYNKEKPNMSSDFALGEICPLKVLVSYENAMNPVEV